MLVMDLTPMIGTIYIERPDMNNETSINDEIRQVEQRLLDPAVRSSLAEPTKLLVDDI